MNNISIALIISDLTHKINIFAPITIFLMSSLSSFSSAVIVQDEKYPVAIMHDGKEKAGAEMIPFHAE